MVRDDRVSFHLYPVLVHLARTVGLPIEIVKYIRDEVRASGIRARQALKGHLQAGSIAAWWVYDTPMTYLRPEILVMQRSAQWKALRLNWTPREERYWDRVDYERTLEDGGHRYHQSWGRLLY